MMEFPCFDRDHLHQGEIVSVSVVGNISCRRWGWNPFDRENELVRLGPSLWWGVACVESEKMPDHSGFYSMRLIINHNPRRQLKARSYSHGDYGLRWNLDCNSLGLQLDNINFKIVEDCEIQILFNSDAMTLSIKTSKPALTSRPVIKAVARHKSYQLNGFIWDELSMFEKFQTNHPGRSFRQDPDGAWSIEVPLRKNGGIDFRADGVYQFLISADFEEDYGFSCINDGQGTLVKGTGFSSSHGTSMHSGCTIKATINGTYRFRLVNPTTTPRIEVQDPLGNRLPLLNQRTSIELLGSIYLDSPFDPTVLGRSLVLDETTGIRSLELETKAGDHCINFAINRELFLDTMGFGCWLIDPDGRDEKNLKGVCWHGKPHEWNIYFHLSEDSHVRYSYNIETDEFSITVLSGPGRLKPVTHLKTLSLVGSFPEPLAAWQPKNPANLMESLGGGRYQRCVDLQAGENYSYKYVGNQSDWQLVFADYELDGYGSNFKGQNTCSGRPTLSSLKRYGRLTTHGNPPALNFVPIHSGPYQFFADLQSGAYSVLPL